MHLAMLWEPLPQRHSLMQKCVWGGWVGVGVRVHVCLQCFGWLYLLKLANLSLCVFNRRKLFEQRSLVL